MSDIRGFSEYLEHLKVTQGWNIYHQPAAATKATITKAAVAGFKHHAIGIFAMCGGTAAMALIPVNLRDGATGAGTILWTGFLVSAANAVSILSFGNIDIRGSRNTAMTLEFNAAGATNTFQSVALLGYTADF